jgi:hypothetical protein
LVAAGIAESHPQSFTGSVVVGLQLQAVQSPLTWQTWEKHMRRLVLSSCIVVGCLSLTAPVATAQEVIHALTGTVSSIDPAGKTITVYTDDRSESLFKDFTNLQKRIEFDKKVRADATAASAFNRKGAYVIVYYFGDGNVRTTVGLRSLGSGPFTKNSGTVVKLEEHSIAIKGESGAVDSFKITSDTVAETGTGAIEGLKFRPQKGDQVQVIATASNGSATALFINAAYAP